MSKKQSLAYRRFYSKGRPGVISEHQDFSLPQPTRSFSEVLKHLEDHKYVHLTAEGSCHLLPKGLFIHEALAAYAAQQLEEEGALRYRFSSFFSTDRADRIWTLVSRFEKQVFKVLGSHEHYLKYASDPVLFKYWQDREVVTPLKIYSPDYFYRVIQSGELRPLIQPREFYMTDFHYFCELGDYDSYIAAALLNKRTMDTFTKDWHLNIDTNTEFFEANQNFFSSMLERLGVDAVINVTRERTHYYSVQNQFVADYYRGNQAQLANLQMDERNGETFNIRSRASGRPISIIHGTLLGRTEKVLALVVGKQLESQAKPTLPAWLSPIHARVMPVSPAQPIRTSVAAFLAELERIRCRYDVDERDVSLQIKVRDAERDWVPFQIVIGEQEVAEGTVSVRNRRTGTEQRLTVAACIRLLEGEGDPRPQLTPKRYSGNAIF